MKLRTLILLTILHCTTSSHAIIDATRACDLAFASYGCSGGADCRALFLSLFTEHRTSLTGIPADLSGWTLDGFSDAGGSTPRYLQFTRENPGATSEIRLLPLHELVQQNPLIRPLAVAGSLNIAAPTVLPTRPPVPGALAPGSFQFVQTGRSSGTHGGGVEYGRFTGADGVAHTVVVKQWAVNREEAAEYARLNPGRDLYADILELYRTFGERGFGPRVLAHYETQDPERGPILHLVIEQLGTAPQTRAESLHSMTQSGLQWGNIERAFEWIADPTRNRTGSQRWNRQTVTAFLDSQPNDTILRLLRQNLNRFFAGAQFQMLEGMTPVQYDALRNGRRDAEGRLTIPGRIDINLRFSDAHDGNVMMVRDDSGAQPRWRMYGIDLEGQPGRRAGSVNWALQSVRQDNTLVGDPWVSDLHPLLR